MSRIAQSVAAFLDSAGWDYQTLSHDEGARFRFPFSGERALVDCWVACYEETERLAVIAHIPIAIPESKRLAVAEYITRANFGILVGNFELDLGDGELRFKTSADVEDTEIGTTFVKNLLAANISSIDRYFPGLMKVLYANMSPADAIAVVRSSH